MRVKCDAFGLECHDYQPQKVIKSVEKLFDGWNEINVEESIIDSFYDEKQVYLDEENLKINLFPNQYLILKSEKDAKKSALCRFQGSG